MISQKTQLETNILGEDHFYQCGTNTSLLNCLEALNTFRFYIIGRIKDADEANKPKVEQTPIPIEE